MWTEASLWAHADILAALGTRSVASANADEKARMKKTEDEVLDSCIASPRAQRQLVAEARKDAQANFAVQARARLDVAEKRLHAAETAFAGEQYAQASRDAEKAAFAAKETIMFTASAQMISTSAELDFSSMAATDKDETEREAEPTHAPGQKEKKEDAHKRSGGNTDSNAEGAVDVGL